MQRAQAVWLPDGRRLHLHHGPIDMIVGAEGTGRDAAMKRAAARFDTLLDDLVSELPRLRAPDGPLPEGETARLMARAVAPFAPAFITPMAAVAGAGAETVLAAIRDGSGVDRAYVNNGGDVAFHLSPGQEIQAAIAAPVFGTIRIRFDDPVRGIATSGRGGRSHSLGIADSVTVLARSAALADAAATLIANAVDLPGHPGITRVPARELSPDSDLGARCVTTQVATLTPGDIAHALDGGALRARGYLARGLITGALMTLQGEARSIGRMPLPQQHTLSAASG